MPTVNVSIELSDAEAAELAVWAEFYGMTQAELIKDAVRDGFLLRRSQHDYDRDPPPPRARPTNDNDVQPVPELVEEAVYFNRLVDSILDPEDREPETLRFTVTVPKAYAVLGAWVIFKEDMRREGDLGVLPRPIRLYLEDGRQGRDWQRAKAYFQRAIHETFDADYTGLMVGTHALLFPPPVLLPEPRPDNRMSDVIDDDIPF